MTRSTAREIAVHLIFSLGFGTQSAEEVLDSELTRERFEELGGESQLYAQFPNEKQERYIRDLDRSWTTTLPAMRWAGPLPAFPAWQRPFCAPPCMRCCICRISPTPPLSTPRWR